MPIRKHGQNYYVRLQIGGRRIERVAGPRRQDAVALETRIRAEAVDARVGRQHKRTIADATRRYLEGEARALKDLAGLKSKLRAILPYTQGRQLSEASDVAEAIKRDMQAQGLASGTINRRLAALRRVLRLAAEWGWIAHPPTVRLLAGEEPRTRTLTETQVKALALACDGPARDCILLGAYTGLRMGEILALQADQVAGDTLILTRTKTGRQRAVPVPQVALPIIARIPLGITYAQLRKAFEAGRIAAGMPEVQFRDLRRTYGSWIVQRTGNLRAAQELLGHTTSTITARHYAHLMTDHLRAAVASLDDGSGGKTGKAGKPARPSRAKKCA